MHSQHTLGSSILTTVVTGLVALIPDGAVNYAEKIVSVFVLAVVAELGRRFVTALLERRKKKP
jgi:hypothetical protein